MINLLHDAKGTNSWSQMPFDKLVFVCHEPTSPSGDWLEYVTQASKNGEGWLYFPRWNWKKSEWHCCKGYGTVHMTSDHKVSVGHGRRNYPKMPCTRIEIQVGDLGWSADGVYGFVEWVVGSENISKTHVMEFDAKYDDNQRNFAWYRKRLWRRYLKKPGDYTSYDTTFYLGDQGKDRIKVYDKVVEGQAAGEAPWCNLQAPYTRVEKTVHLDSLHRYNWVNFLAHGVIEHNPFNNVIVGNIDNVQKYKLRYRGLHDWVVGLKRGSAEREQLLDSVLTDMPLVLADEWEKRVRAWSVDFLAEHS